MALRNGAYQQPTQELDHADKSLGSKCTHARKCALCLWRLLDTMCTAAELDQAAERDHSLLVPNDRRERDRSSPSPV